MAISEELELDISGALDAIESLNEPLTALGENLTITLTTAIEAVDVQPLADQLAAIDAAGLTTTIDASIDAVDGTVPIEADTEAVPGEIDASIASADTTVTLDADTADFGGSIDEALAAADATVTVDADASSIAPDIEAEISGADTSVSLDVDSGGLEGVTSQVDDVEGSISGLDATVAGAAGGFARFGGAAVIGGALVTGAFFSIVNAGREAEAAQQRFNSTLGKFAKDARTINVGSLNTSLEDLAIRLGSDDEKALQATATLFQFAKAAGLSGEQASGFANNVQALAARAVALNPALGDTGDVAVAMAAALGRGQKATAKFNIALSTNEILQRALDNTGKTLASDLSVQEKSFAGAQIAAEKYGAGLEKDIAKGSKNAEVQQRSLNERLQDFIEAAGQPLVAPFQQLLEDLLPVAEKLIPIFGELAKKLLPILAEVIADIAPPLAAFVALAADLISKVPAEVIAAIAAAFLAFKGFSIASDAVSKIKDIGTGFVDAGGKMKAFFAAGGGFDGLRLQAIGAKNRIADIGRQFATLATQLGKRIIATVQTKVVTEGAGGVAGGAGGAAGGGLLSTIAKKLGLKAAAGGGGAALFTATLPITIAVATLAVILLNQDAIKNSPISETLGDIFYDLGQGIVGDLIRGFTDGINSGFTALGQFLVEFIPNSIITPIKQALGIGSPSTVFFGIGVDIILGLLGGLASLVPTVLQFFGGLPARILTAVGNVASGARSLVQKGIDLIGGLLSGLGQKFGEVLNFVGSIPGRIVSGIPNVARILFDVGKRIIGGLIDGMVKGLGPLGSFLKGVGGFIKDHKPIATDHLILKPAGEAIIQGLADSMEATLPAVENALSKVTSTIADAKIPALPLLPAVTAALPVSAGPAAGTAGAVTSAQADLQGTGSGVHIGQLIVQTAAKDQTQVGIEVSRQLRAESFRAGR